MNQQHMRRKRRPDLPLSTETSIPMKYPIITPSRVKDLLLLLSLLVILYLLFFSPLQYLRLPSITRRSASFSTTRRRHLLFSIAASSDSWRRRSSYVRLWYSPNTTRALAFLDRSPAEYQGDAGLPPIVVSGDTSRFPYTFPEGLRSAIRVARVVKEAVDREEQGVRWFVFGDDDTVFFVDNLVKVLSKYDHNKWFYVGSNSESYEQNVRYSFDMAFGGGGFAISASLAKGLAGVLDSCLMRYSHLYGSDSRIFSCLAELGVGLTHEPGFHQIDIRGNLFGLLCGHPLSPLVSLHHLDAVDPIFPNMNKTQAIEHLFTAVTVDHSRVLQQSVCYHRSNSLTVSVSWGYAVQVYEGNKFLPDLLSLQKSFTTWRRGSRVPVNYMFNTRDYPRDPCERPSLFYFDSVGSDGSGIWSSYVRNVAGKCRRAKSVKNLKLVRVLSSKLDLDMEQMTSPRRHCCDISPSFNESMVINIRKCRVDEIISIET